MSAANVKTAVLARLASGTEFGVAELIAETGASRQAIHHHLRPLVAQGLLQPTGRGRATRYRAARPGSEQRLELPLQGLEEHLVWQRLVTTLPPLQRLAEPTERLVYFAFTELLNNAVDHSGGSRAVIDVKVDPRTVRFELRDDGEGIFAHVRRVLALESDLDALQQLSKGKLTTDPARHTGQGIFFSSKAADRFELESGALRWVVDNLRQDVALFQVDPPVLGTVVRFELALDTPRRLKEVFDAYTAEAEGSFGFTRSRAHIKLFETGLQFVSRSEAKRLLADLEKFEEVILDFAGVTGVGQGFVDEVFRVWPSAHPKTRLQPVNMVPAVEFMVKRGLPSRPP